MCETISAGVRVWGNVNRDSLVKVIYETQPITSYYEDGAFQVQFGCPSCLESFLLEYDTNEDQSASYEVFIGEPVLEVVTHILCNLETIAFKIDEYEITATFDNLQSAKIFIALYNDILDGLDQEDQEDGCQAN